MWCGSVCGSLFLVFAAIWGGVSSQNPHRRFEYKYSFKAPYLAQKDNQVPFWEYSGNAIASSESMRITPSLRSQKGQAWSKLTTTFDWWEVEIVFRINGRGRVGADGLAFWYTTAQGVEGPVFGSSDKWNGLGLFFDSFDNDNKRNNPYVMAMVNDGTKAYDHENDGMSQLLGGCLRDFRNKPHPVRAKIEYFKNTLTILIHNGLTPSDKDYEICTRVENVVLPPNGYFGLSAATGGLADDHDVLKFLVTSLRSPDELTTLENNREQEEQFQKEFQAYQEKTQKAREEYVAAHPDATPRHADEDEDFEGSETRELRQIFQGQSQIYDVIRQLNAKMDEIIGRQERTLSLVGAVHSGLAASGGVPIPPAGASGSAGAPPIPAAGGGVISRFEVDSIMGTQRDIAQTAKDVKTVVMDINQKSSQILGKPVGSAQPVGGGSYDMHVTLKELNEGLNSIKHTLGSQQQQQRGGPTVMGSCPSCLSTWLFVGVAVTQLVVILGYMMFRDNKEAQAKKFY